MRAALRARTRAVEQCQQDLSEILDRAEAAQRAERRAVDAISDEAKAATAIEAGDIAVEAFAAWLPEARRAVTDLRARRDEAEARVVVARAALAAARSSEAATQALLDRHQRQSVADKAHRSQLALDEAAARVSCDPAPATDVPAADV